MAHSSPSKLNLCCVIYSWLHQNAYFKDSICIPMFFGTGESTSTLESEHWTNWGDWGNWEYCPSGHIAIGMEPKIEVNKVNLNSFVFKLTNLKDCKSCTRMKITREARRVEGMQKLLGILLFLRRNLLSLCI